MTQFIKYLVLNSISSRIRFLNVQGRVVQSTIKLNQD